MGIFLVVVPVENDDDRVHLPKRTAALPLRKCRCVNQLRMVSRISMPSFTDTVNFSDSALSSERIFLAFSRRCALNRSMRASSGACEHAPPGSRQSGSCVLPVATGRVLWKACARQWGVAEQVHGGLRRGLAGKLDFVNPDRHDGAAEFKGQVGVIFRVSKDVQRIGIAAHALGRGDDIEQGRDKPAVGHGEVTQKRQCPLDARGRKGNSVRLIVLAFVARLGEQAFDGFNHVDARQKKGRTVRARTCRSQTAIRPSAKYRWSGLTNSLVML